MGALASAVGRAKVIYISPRDDVADEVLIPCLSVATTFRCMTGFFDSGVLRELAHGLAEHIQHASEPMRLIVSPFVSKEDRLAIDMGLATPAEVAEAQLLRVFGEARLSAGALARHTLSCLAYLISTGRLEIKVAIPKGEGLFHMKVWIFSSGDETVVCDGSTNATRAGVAVNVEQVRVSKSWEAAGEAAVHEFATVFASLWAGRWQDMRIVPLPEAARRDLLRDVPEAPPSSKDYEIAATVVPEFRHPAFEVPLGVEYRSGRYAHQGRAVDAWEAAGRRGILEMATGAGKTKTALIAAQRLWEDSGRLLLVIAAPTRPLVEQWASECRTFRLRPHDSGSHSSRQQIALMRDATSRLRLGVTTIEAIIVTHDFLTDPEGLEVLNGSEVPTMLVGDEVHALGRRGFIEDPPAKIAYRMGLSATPDRQYDPRGTDALQRYFGPVCFTFGLAEAIGICLVPYEYHVHPVELEHDEVERWEDLTKRLLKLGFQDADGDISAAATILLNRRRAILETAVNKLASLEHVLQKHGVAAGTLIYASDKGPAQLRDVNHLLAKMGVSFHQLTAEETSDRKAMGRILDQFRTGSLTVLTAKRVLDEGVDIPQTRVAYILASTTVERQWIQRRGRVLRQYPGKEKAILHDFVVLPPGGLWTPALGRVVHREVERVMAFAELALNAGDRGGPVELAVDLLKNLARS